MAWCAGTSTRPRSDRLAAFSIAMTGTGSRASPRSWKARTVSSRSCIGRRSPDAAPPPLPRRRERRHRLRILLATDAWAPQVNGVVMTLRNTIRGLEAAGHVVETISPDRFRNIPCPTYPEIRLALHPFPRFADLAHRFEPDAVHIATEGPVGQAARKFCLREQLAFTTAYHTRFPGTCTRGFDCPCASLTIGCVGFTPLQRRSWWPRQPFTPISSVGDSAIS